VADGCAEAADAGLSNFGRRLVREMNHVGMVVDGSHTGRRSSIEAIELSDLPVIFSHSGARALHAHSRNLFDDQIRACASGGGVIGVVGVGAFLGDQAATARSVFEHIDYIVSLVGPQHVGIGSDFVGIFPASAYPQAWEAAAAVPDVRSWPDAQDAWPDEAHAEFTVEEGACFAPEQLVDLLSLFEKNGYSIDVINGILGRNFRRVYQIAEAHRAAVADLFKS
jgi:membrane dipeptidase